MSIGMTAVGRRAWRAATVLLLLLVPARAAADPVGGEFQVNTYTPGHQYEPAVATDGAGNFVVVWTTPQDPESKAVALAAVPPASSLHFG
jgi:hypothetical protein